MLKQTFVIGALLGYFTASDVQAVRQHQSSASQDPTLEDMMLDEEMGDQPIQEEIDFYEQQNVDVFEQIDEDAEVEADFTPTS